MLQVTARPAPDTVLAATGVLRWELEPAPGTTRTIELLTVPMTVRGAGSRPSPATVDRPPPLWPTAGLEADDPRAGALLAASLGDLQALLLRDPAHRADPHLASGAPWRLWLAPADALWAARMLLPFGTRLAVGTLRTLARVQDPDTGRLPGMPREEGAWLPPLCSGVEATLLFVTVLEEARRWGCRSVKWRRSVPASGGLPPVGGRGGRGRAPARGARRGAAGRPRGGRRQCAHWAARRSGHCG
jgi:hypothetical protein